ncbi:MAG TPA: HEAT repeat domain-containing protein [Pyrinomonadaceae bacterium]|nr:HEAT repeat domain-containing protein [Pyrinomonadaceae bacterium]
MTSGRDAPQPSAATPRPPCRAAGRPAVIFFAIAAALTAAPPAPAAPTLPPGRQSAPTPLQHEVEKQKARLASPEVEERRDAVTRLGALARPEGSLAAAAALGDPAAVVRATAARAVLSLPRGEASRLILPLLRDRDEFVRREAAYALGLAGSAVAVPALAEALETDREAAVRGAAAVALGQIGDPAAAPFLAGSLSRRLPPRAGRERPRRRRVEQDEFARRAAAVSLGQLRSREAVPVLIETLADERAPDDLRREAARALGLIGDRAAVPALRAALTARDPYLARIAFDAVRALEAPAPLTN